MAQSATTGNLESAQRTIIATARYTEEHNAPAMSLIESMNYLCSSSLSFRSDFCISVFWEFENLF